MAKLIIALTVMLVMDAFFFLGQTSVLAVNPDGPSFYNYENESRIGEFDKGNYTLTDAQDGAEDFPDATTGVTSDDTGTFTDAFKTIKAWITSGYDDVVKGGKYIWSILGGPYSYLMALGLPSEFAFAIGAVWYGTTFLLLVAFATGRALE